MKIGLGGSPFGPGAPDKHQIEIVEAVVRWLLPVGENVGGGLALSRVNEEIVKVLAGEQSWSSARSALRLMLSKRGYTPEDNSVRGTILDFTSEPRLNVVAQTALRMAAGFISWKQSQIESVLFMWPASEFRPMEEWDEWNDWRKSWIAAGGQVFPPGKRRTGDRMIALKNSGIWERVNKFGLPHGPFDFNSGMDIRDIDGEEAERLGLFPVDATIMPQERSPTDDLSDDSELRRKLSTRFEELVQFLMLSKV